MNLNEWCEDNKREDLLREWNYAKNGELKPSDYLSQSNKKVWWKCSKGHEWQSTIAHRVGGRGCPYCSNRSVLPGYNDLATIYPELAKEWNYDKNGDITPSTVTSRSSRIVWWKCSKGHEWKSAIGNRSAGNNCPYCSNQKILHGYNDLATTDPDIAKEWNYEKNNGITPYMIPRGTIKKYWWKCSKGHEWFVSVNSRTFFNSGCPYCSGRLPIKGVNDFSTVYPELASEWNYEKNQNSPSDYTKSSNKNVWWKCFQGHEWKASIADRVAGNGCPFCGNKRILVGYNDLATTNPELVKEWNYKRNGNLKPTDITSGNKKYVWWICGRGHEWKASIGNRSRGSGCPLCSKGKKTSLPEYILYFYLNRITTSQWSSKQFGWEIDVYLPEICTGIEYDGRLWHSSDDAHYRDENKESRLLEHGIKLYRIKESDRNQITDNVIEYKREQSLENLDWAIKELISILSEKYGFENTCEIDIENDYQQIKTEYDAACNIQKNTFVLNHPDKASEWNYEKNNGIVPELFPSSAKQVVWWKCSKGHEWQDSILDRAHGKKCPYCSNRRLIKGFNDLMTINPELASEWNYEKNGSLTPSDVKATHSVNKVWWKDKYGHEWEATVTARAVGKGKCPFCRKNKYS